MIYIQIEKNLNVVKSNFTDIMKKLIALKVKINEINEIKKINTIFLILTKIKDENGNICDMFNKIQELPNLFFCFSDLDCGTNIFKPENIR